MGVAKVRRCSLTVGTEQVNCADERRKFKVRMQGDLRKKWSTQPHKVPTTRQKPSTPRMQRGKVRTNHTVRGCMHVIQLFCSGGTCTRRRPLTVGLAAACHDGGVQHPRRL